MIRNRTPHVRAMLLHREIKRIQDAALSDPQVRKIMEKANRDIEALLKKTDIDKETADFLQKLLGKERPLSEREKVGIIAEEVVKRRFEQIGQINEHAVFLVLSTTGELYREPKNQYCYSMAGGKNLRLKIVRALLERKGLYQTSELADALGTDVRTVRNAIGEINRIASQKLSLPDDETLIVSRRSQGYMTNPNFHILDGQL